MKDAARLYEGKEWGGSYITKGDATNEGTRPSRGLKKKIRKKTGNQVVGKVTVHNSLREHYGN